MISAVLFGRLCFGKSSFAEKFRESDGTPFPLKQCSKLHSCLRVLQVSTRLKSEAQSLKFKLIKTKKFANFILQVTAAKKGCCI